MTRVNYPGLSDPVRAFTELTPMVEQLRALQLMCRPFGPDYLALAIALEGLQTAAYHFTRRPHFWTGSTP